MTQENVVADVPLPIPGVSSAYRHGWQRLWKNFFDLFLGLIIMLAISVPIGLILAYAIFPFVENQWAQQIINYAVSFFIFGPLGFGWAYMTLRSARGEKIEVQHLFQGFRRYGPSVLAYFLITLFTMIPILIAYIFLLILMPLGVIVSIAAIFAVAIISCKLAFTPFLLFDENLGGYEAIKASWDMTDGHAGTIFLIYLLGIPISIAGALCFLVGIIPAAMWIYMAIASLYYAVDGRKVGITAPSDSLPTPPPDTSGPFQPV